MIIALKSLFWTEVLKMVPIKNFQNSAISNNVKLFSYQCPLSGTKIEISLVPVTFFVSCEFKAIKLIASSR